MITLHPAPPRVSPSRGRFTIVFLIHEAFRRDLARLSVAVRSGGDAASACQLRAHWEFVSEQLHHHHTVEDRSLWPLVRSKLVRQPEDLAVLDEMEQQHLALDPRVRAVDEGFAALAEEPSQAVAMHLAASLDDLAAALGEHLEAEETTCFPIVDWALSFEEFESFGKATAKAAGVRGAARLFPWIFDDADPVERKAVLKTLPLPVRVLCRCVWEPRYRRQSAELWAGYTSMGYRRSGHFVQ